MPKYVGNIFGLGRSAVSSLKPKVTGVSALGVQRLFDLTGSVAIKVNSFWLHVCLLRDLKVVPLLLSNACPAGDVQIHP
ncbi:hypothetical protein CFF01_03795 [Shewanella marisflavi]|uniref:Uncharacterized protein n=1 Tax=Shewanella marisflavi TaxID=260364 RepID=A0AAC9XMA7_9GAMM|nr:hypothetical protein CFF01_03795 [Shewanella marisflavi]